MEIGLVNERVGEKGENRGVPLQNGVILGSSRWARPPSNRSEAVASDMDTSKITGWTEDRTKRKSVVVRVRQVSLRVVADGRPRLHCIPCFSQVLWELDYSLVARSLIIHTDMRGWLGSSMLVAQIGTIMHVPHLLPVCSRNLAGL